MGPYFYACRSLIVLDSVPFDTLYICSLEAFSLGQVESSRIGSPQVSEVFSKLAALVSTVAAEVSGTSHTTYIAAVGNTTYREVVLYRAQVCPREKERGMQE